MAQDDFRTKHPEWWNTSCPQCGEKFAKNGLKIHITRAHKQKEGKNKAIKSIGAIELIECGNNLSLYHSVSIFVSFHPLIPLKGRRLWFRLRFPTGTPCCSAERTILERRKPSCRTCFTRLPSRSLTFRIFALPSLP
jgi:hypothetical protein